MLHIVTALYRPENLLEIYKSIPSHEDIVWHIAKSDKTEKIKVQEILLDKRIQIYEVDCLDSEIYLKKRKILGNIKDGYFCFLDDDTIFHENMYLEYSKVKNENFEGLIIGRQMDKFNRIKLTPSVPKSGKIDMNNVISNSSCLPHVEWPNPQDIKTSNIDYFFWLMVWEFFRYKVKLINKTISIYNKLNNQRHR